MDPAHIIKAIKKCQKSPNPKAFKVLYAHYSGEMYAVCLRYLRRESVAQDVLQETFISAYFNIKNYQFKGPFGAWVRRIAVNNCLQELRKNKKDIMIVQDPQNSGFDQPEVNNMDSITDIGFQQEEDFGQRLVDLLNRLPIGYKTILNLFVIEEYSHKEIAEIMGISESTSRSQLTRAKAALRKVASFQELKTELYD